MRGTHQITSKFRWRIQKILSGGVEASSLTGELGCSDNRIAVRFQYECHDQAGQWHRAYGNENWEFDESGLMRTREASINDVLIEESERKFHWPVLGVLLPFETITGGRHGFSKSAIPRAR